MSTAHPFRTPLVSALGVLLLLATAACGDWEQDRIASAAAASSSSVAAASSAVAQSSAAAAASSAAVALSAAGASRSSAAAAAASAAAARAAAESRAAREAQSAAAAAAAAQSVADAAAAAGPAADPDTPGDDAGARCENNPQYADEQPTGMRVDVAAAWVAADAAAAAQGVTLCLGDGKRSRLQQQETYDEYMTQYGAAMADQYVLPPEKSAHVLGLAIDVQPYAAYTWLEGTRGAQGFCRTYDNEAWHFEYDPTFVTAGCPFRLPHPGA